ncbi:MAG: YceI family protein [Bacteroidetes bacterium]|nr:YceI family protein [Bacteroidota bacterium]
MMKRIVIVCLLAFVSTISFGQNRYFTKNGKVYFDCTTPASPEKIEGTNEKATSIIDASTGAIEFALAMKAFAFERALMGEHFNENYVESDTYPKCSFKGSVENMSAVDLKKDGTYNVKVKGMMTLHGVTKEVEAAGTVTVKGGAIVAAKSEFKIKLADFNITIPSVVKDKIAAEAKIKVDLTYQPLVK